MIPVGLDIGTGFVKVSASGRHLIFPSLIGRILTDDRSPGEATAAGGGQKKRIVERAGKGALDVGSNRHGSLIRPVRHGLPYDDAGFGLLVQEAIAMLGNGDSVAIVAGVPHDPHGDPKKHVENSTHIQKIINKHAKPELIRIVPQAYGTLKSCSKKFGTVINIGHGTTEIITVTKNGFPDGFSIDRAADFVISQLGAGQRREDYVNYERLLSADPKKTERLVRMLASHIADDVSRIKIVEPLILAGGGSQLPGIKERFEELLGVEITIPDNPTFANAVGYEMIAKELITKDRGGNNSSNDGTLRKDEPITDGHANIPKDAKPGPSSNISTSSIPKVQANVPQDTKSEQ